MLPAAAFLRHKVRKLSTARYTSTEASSADSASRGRCSVANQEKTRNWITAEGCVGIAQPVARLQAVHVAISMVPSDFAS
ncbi:hypothetical protein BLJAPNOD_04153 [Ensifer sp. M14]|nr:hypothetical protein BLJAPNOD_04153 [Ensifer sp. M14]